MSLMLSTIYMAKNTGHSVLRLPPYHCELNPIELAWAMVKTYVKQNNNTFNIDDVWVLLNTANVLPVKNTSDVYVIIFFIIFTLPYKQINILIIFTSYHSLSI